MFLLLKVWPLTTTTKKKKKKKKCKICYNQFTHTRSSLRGKLGETVLEDSMDVHFRRMIGVV